MGKKSDYSGNGKKSNWYFFSTAYRSTEPVQVSIWHTVPYEDYQFITVKVWVIQWDPFNIGPDAICTPTPAASIV